MMQAATNIFTTRDIAAHFGVEVHRVRYAIQSRDIRPVQTAGGVGLYLPSQLSAIGEALTETAKKPSRASLASEGGSDAS